MQINLTLQGYHILSNFFMMLLLICPQNDRNVVKMPSSFETMTHPVWVEAHDPRLGTGVVAYDDPMTGRTLLLVINLGDSYPAPGPPLALTHAMLRE